MDKSRTGTLSIEEIRSCLEEVYGGLSATEDWTELVEKMDVDGNGRIDFGEFIVAASNSQKLLTDKNIDIVFKMLDLDGDNVIKLSELKAIFNTSKLDNKEEKEIMDGIMGAIDTEHDDVIDKNEFNGVMRDLMKKRSL